MKKKRIFLLILFLAVFALGFGIIGAGLCSSAHIQKKTCSAAAEGRVIEYRRNSHIGNKRMYTPVVEYRAGNEILKSKGILYSKFRFEHYHPAGHTISCRQQRNSDGYRDNSAVEQKQTGQREKTKN